jgi:dihydroorotase
LPIERLIELFSLGPQKIMKVERWGIFEGSAGHLTILDPRMKWRFDVNRSRSKSRNSPFHSWEFTGRAVATIVNGKVAYQAD